MNKVKNPALQRQLNAYGRDVGYRGFVMVVLGLLFCSAASKCVHCNRPRVHGSGISGTDLHSACVCV